MESAHNAKGSPRTTSLTPTIQPTNDPLTLIPTSNPPTTANPFGEATFSSTTSPTRVPIMYREYYSFFRIKCLLKAISVGKQVVIILDT